MKPCYPEVAVLVRHNKKIEFWRRIGREFVYAFFIGSIPTLLSSNASELRSMVNTLLTPQVLMEYYMIIVFVFMVVSGIILRARFFSERFHRMLLKIHEFLVNIGASLLTACRAALGAMIGFLLLWGYQDPETLTLAGVYRTVCYASFTVVVCAALAGLDEALRDPHAINHYR